MHKNARSALLVLAILLPVISALDDGHAAEKLSLKDCIETALKNQPAIRAARLHGMQGPFELREPEL